MKKALVAAAMLAGTPPAARAHGLLVDPQASWWWQWDFSWTVSVPLLLTAWAYGCGVRRLWQRAGTGRGVSRRQAGSFAAGMLVLVGALMSPLEALSASAFWLHMVQHLLLILVAPPLLIAGAAETAFLWALPRRYRPRFGRLTRRLGIWLGNGPGAGANRMVVVALATGVLWVWHIPQLYDMAVRNETIHFTEHASFLVTALAFWASVIRLRPTDHGANGARIFAVVAMALQGSLLGALITFATVPLYDVYRNAAAPLGLTPLADQQMAGVIMWVPPAFLYLGVAAYLFVSWLESLNRRPQRA